jgi:hypothetical protein
VKGPGGRCWPSSHMVITQKARHVYFIFSIHLFIYFPIFSLYQCLSSCCLYPPSHSSLRTQVHLVQCSSLFPGTPTSLPVASIPAGEGPPEHQGCKLTSCHMFSMGLVSFCVFCSVVLGFTKHIRTCAWQEICGLDQASGAFAFSEVIRQRPRRTKSVWFCLLT